MQNVLELQFLVDDLVDFLKLSMFINKRMTMSKKDDRPPYQKSMFSITNKGAGLSLDIWPSRKALKRLLQIICLMLDLFYRKCNHLFMTVVADSIFKKIDYNLK